MAPIVATVEVARPPAEVFAYVTDPGRLSEWQPGVIGGRMLDSSPPGVGSRFVAITRIGGAQQESTIEITDYAPPRTWAVRGVDGPVRVVATVAITPLADGSASRLTITLDFQGQGPAGLLVRLVVRPQAAREAPHTIQRLKERLQNG